MQHGRCNRNINSLIHGLIAICLITPTYAVSPIEGWYGGAYLGVSYAANISANFVTPFQELPSGKASISYSVLGGVGGQIGYRFEPFRVEGQFMYNNNPYNSVNIGNVSIDGSGTYVNNELINTPLTIQGQTNTGSFLVNALYDFYSPSNDNVSAFVPYLGLGLGVVYVQNNLQFQNNGATLPMGDLSGNFTTAAGQGIIGFNYFLDDYTTMGLDFRYFTTLANNKTTQFKYNTFNYRETIYSINLLFNGAFNFG